jgi:hypothetical protein
MSARLELAWLEARYDGCPYPPGIWARIKELHYIIARAARAGKEG